MCPTVRSQTAHWWLECVWEKGREETSRNTWKPTQSNPSPPLDLNYNFLFYKWLSWFFCFLFILRKLSQCHNSISGSLTYGWILQKYGKTLIIEEGLSTFLLLLDFYLVFKYAGSPMTQGDMVPPCTTLSCSVGKGRIEKVCHTNIGVKISILPAQAIVVLQKDSRGLVLTCQRYVYRHRGWHNAKNICVRMRVKFSPWEIMTIASIKETLKKKHRHRRNVTSHHSFSLLWQF